MRGTLVSFMSFWSIAHAFKQKPSSFLGYSYGRQISATLVQAASPLVDYSVQEWTASRIEEAMVKAFGASYKNKDPMLTIATKPEFGDYQCNVALTLAKPIGLSPREVATQLATALDLNEIFYDPTVSGPGFINLKLRTDFLSEQIKYMLHNNSDRLGIPPVQKQQRIVVDFSSPNIAKEMHVGHLRSTIIGDTISRILEFRGHNVLRLNHVGDWGTQFGMLISYLQSERPDVLNVLNQIDGTTDDTKLSASNVNLGDIVEFYKKAKHRFDEDPSFRTMSRNAVVALQAGDSSCRQAWELLCDASREEFKKIYDILGVRIEERGESFYNHLLPSIIDDLTSANLIDESGGAKVVWLEGYRSRDGGPQPLFVQKSDGGFMYATTDLVRKLNHSLSMHISNIELDVFTWQLTYRRSLVLLWKS